MSVNCINSSNHSASNTQSNSSDSSSSSSSGSLPSARQLENKLGDLKTSNREVNDLVTQVFTSENSSPELQALATQFLTQRNQKATMLSNMLRTITDGANSIIRNIRA